MKAINSGSAPVRADGLERLKSWLNEAEAVIIGAGAGLSTAAGFTYSGERFEKNFSDFARRWKRSERRVKTLDCRA